MADPTPYPELNDVLLQMVTGMRHILGDSFLGVYLQGSFAVGDFDEHSDVDFVVAIEEELDQGQVPPLQELHARIYDLACPWAQHLEGSYFPTDILRDRKQAGSDLWYLDHGARSLIRSDHCNTVVVRWVVRQQGVKLAGPDPASLVDPIPVAVLRQEILDTILEWGAEILAAPERFNNRFYQGYLVLNHCRMLHDLHAGRAGSKRVGAEWVKATVAKEWLGLIDRAWNGRPDPAVSVRQRPDPREFQRTLRFLAMIMAESKRVAAEFGVTWQEGVAG